LAISASEVKNEQPIETDLPVASSRLIRKYLRSYRAQVSTAPGSWLFPTRPGGTHISPSALSNHIFTVIHRETGLEVNAHLFRHLAGMLYLTRHPGQYEVFRRILGHKSVSTTTAFYTSFDSKWAIHHYDETILAQRDTVR
jgi:site-specific recombinase XerD